MKLLIPFLLLITSSALFAQSPSNVTIETSKGNIEITLFAKKAPISVANFLAYIKKDNYKNSVFHRVINGFMIQGGGFLANGQKMQTNGAIENESHNGLSNLRGTLAMARTNAPHSAKRQFFINHKDNLFLDGAMNKWGYSVFGKVVTGMDIVDEIALVATNSRDKPLQPIIIYRIVLNTQK
ncbi:cyclophilin type peptidyl-prolyl cis-trans isomerase [Psychromonas sp. CNPT3]|uniref:peptidylprolyl isomerase n=1 Tax=Psychromonas sp. CNPT3 TaxID=314282 RepID=UPI00006E8AE0|nr:peptidylprolyl isomerase [Psychromonas sp. CNPT3]AGH80749.1 cyclophilin type peptidyl-prolyl cis-trans isomerase [Psychromonas sp. CNPT3]